MFSREEINQAIEDEQMREPLYLKGVLDLVKWTSAIATAALLWVSGVISSFAGLPQWLAFAGLFFFILSIVVAVLTVKQVLTAWGKTWAVAIEGSYVLRTWNTIALRRVKELEAKYGHLSSNEFFMEMTKAGESYPSADVVRSELEQAEPLFQAAEAASPYANPRRFNIRVSLQISLLLVGLVFYVIAQAFATL